MEYTFWQDDRIQIVLPAVVLILILMEYTFWPEYQIAGIDKHGKS